MNQEPILKYNKKTEKQLLIQDSKLYLILLFVAGILIALITYFLSEGLYTANEIRYAEFTFQSDAFYSSSIINSFLIILHQNLIEIIAVGLIPAISITVFARQLISLLLILKGVWLCRYIGVTIHLCKQSIVVNHPIISTIVAFLAVIVFNILIICLSLKALKFSDELIKNKKDNNLSFLFSSESTIFLQTFLTVLGTVIIISIFKAFLLWIISLI